jgi:hypothetical protein
MITFAALFAVSSTGPRWVPTVYAILVVGGLGAWWGYRGWRAGRTRRLIAHATVPGEPQRLHIRVDAWRELLEVPPIPL